MSNPSGCASSIARFDGRWIVEIDKLRPKDGSKYMHRFQFKDEVREQTGLEVYGYSLRDSDDNPSYQEGFLRVPSEAIAKTIRNYLYKRDPRPIITLWHDAKFEADPAKSYVVILDFLLTKDGEKYKAPMDLSTELLLEGFKGIGAVACHDNPSHEGYQLGCVQVPTDSYGKVVAAYFKESREKVTAVCGPWIDTGYGPAPVATEGAEEGKGKDRVVG